MKESRVDSTIRLEVGLCKLVIGSVIIIVSVLVFQ